MVYFKQIHIHVRSWARWSFGIDLHRRKANASTANQFFSTPIPFSAWYRRQGSRNNQISWLTCIDMQTARHAILHDDCPSDTTFFYFESRQEFTEISSLRLQIPLFIKLRIPVLFTCIFEPFIRYDSFARFVIYAMKRIFNPLKQLNPLISYAVVSVTA